MNLRVAALTMGLLAASLTACSTTVQPPAPAPVWTAAPAVPAALPTAVVLDEPCEAISENQRQTLGYLAEGAYAAYISGLSCIWHVAPDPDTITITLENYQTRSLSATYRDKPHDAYFVPLTVAGYPAVFADHVDARAQGNCILWLAVTDKVQAMIQTAFTDGPPQTNSCAAAKALGEAMIHHLEGTA